MAKGKKGSGQHNPKTDGGPDSVRGNLGALILEVQKTNNALESDASIQDFQNMALQNINNVIVDIYNDVHSIAEALVGNRLKELEDAKERNKQMEELIAAIKEGRKPEKKEQKSGDFSWLGLAATLVAGIVAGGMAFIKNYIKGLQVFWMAIAKSLKIEGIILKIFGAIKSAFTMISNFIGPAVAKAYAFISKIFTGNILGPLKTFFTTLVNSFKSLTNLNGIAFEFRKMMIAGQKAMSVLFGSDSALAKFFGFFTGSKGGSFLSYFDEMLKFFAPLKSFFARLGSVLGKLALPLQVIMSVWDTVSGALDGWNKTEGDFMAKFFGALKGGLSGLLNGLIGGLLDLLKDGVSWILEALGFDKAAAALDSFSFSDLITRMVGGLFDMVEGMVRFVIDIFKNPGKALEKLQEFASNISNAAKEVLKSLLRMVLPDPTAGFAQKLASKAIPDAVYEFAGMDPKTGKLTEEKAAPTPVAQVAQQGLEQVQAVNTQGQQAVKETAAAVQAEGMKLNLRPSLQRPQGGGTAPAVPISSSTTKWDPEDAMGRGMYGFGA